MNSSVYKKAMENVRNYRYVKIVTTEGRMDCLLSEPNYHTTKCFSQILRYLNTDTHK